MRDIRPSGDQFWLLTGTIPAGPYSVSQIHGMLASGETTWQTRACPVGGGAWVALVEMPGFGPTATAEHSSALATHPPRVFPVRPPAPESPIQYPSPAEPVEGNQMSDDGSINPDNNYLKNLECPRCKSPNIKLLPPNGITPERGFKCDDCATKLTSPSARIYHGFASTSLGLVIAFVAYQSITTGELACQVWLLAIAAIVFGYCSFVTLRPVVRTRRVRKPESLRR